MGDEVIDEMERIRTEACKVADELKAACRAVHEKQKGAGGAAMCICGMGCGGSPACGALGILRNHLRYGGITSKQPATKLFIETLRDWL